MGILIIVNKIRDCPLVAADLILLNIGEFYFSSLGDSKLWLDEISISRILVLDNCETVEYCADYLGIDELKVAMLKVNDNASSILNYSAFSNKNELIELKDWISTGGSISNGEKDLMIKVGPIWKRINKGKIRIIESDGKNISLILESRVFSLRNTLKGIRDSLPSNFIRVHASFIVNLNFIESISLKDQFITIGTKNIPFSRQYKKILIENFEFG